MASSGCLEGPAIASPAFFEPTAPMPVSSEIGGLRRNHNQVEGARINCSIATGARVAFARRIWLNRNDCLVHPKTAQTITAPVAAKATITNPMSNAVLFCSLNGLRPIEGDGRWV